jgi:hypothetical protein
MVAATIRQPVGQSLAALRKEVRPGNADLRRAAYEMVDKHCHFHGRAGGFQFVQQDDVLIVRGQVPSYYLKQVLQTALKDVDGIRWVDNQVDVVSCNGLSSSRDR